ncbi:PilN family type IVB pilus formation outer membrane protein [Herbaspirillum sp. YR522]|uniref:PilN family type IVB pilus formation outer membrane protein n=1 Tax=Herbaspirillum sp. YR522 TaxID=1144342 RepID=UPI00026F913E|nr:PilN family type IVB pilus formation outer membrane protein [Herbaspirillum sp. YR522]EJN02931.1 type IVB pilus formation outer membrane protein, R64 PilN family [Herbaspirillum sp. YR522]
MKAYSIKLPMLLPLAVLIAGCSGLANKLEGQVDQEGERATRLSRDVGRTAPGTVMPSSPLVKHEPGIWLGKTAIKLGQPSLPPIFYEPTTFDRTINSLTELAERITLRSGIPSKVSADALEVSGGAFRPRNLAGLPTSANPALRAAPGMIAQSNGPMLPLPAGLPGEGQSSPVQPGRGPAANTGQTQPTFTDLPNGVRIAYNSGSLKGLLDTAAARFGVSWKFSDGVIQFFHTESRNFQISAIPGDSTFSATVTSGASSTGGAGGSSGGGGGGGGGGSGGGSSSTGVNANNTQNTQVASKLSVYTGLESAIKVMLSPYGRVLASPATGSITVVDTPDSLERIASYIDGENKSLSRQIAINVTVLSVTLSDSDQYGINWSAVYKSLNSNFGISNAYAGAAATGLVSLTAGIPAGGTSKFAGSQAVMQALSEQGRVRRQTTASVVTLNNQPVPVQVARQTTYLQSLQTSLVAQVGSTTSLTPGVVTAGFNMSILPHMLTNGTVMLQFSTDISTLRRIRTIVGTSDASGRVTSQIESPELDTRNFLQRVAMKSNETLIISGFEQTDDDLGRSGVGVAKNMALGGGYSASSNKEVIVVLITPVAMGSAS